MLITWLHNYIISCAPISCPAIPDDRNTCSASRSTHANHLSGLVHPTSSGKGQLAQGNSRESYLTTRHIPTAPGKATRKSKGERLTIPDIFKKGKNSCKPVGKFTQIELSAG